MEINAQVKQLTLHIRRRQCTYLDKLQPVAIMMDEFVDSSIPNYADECLNID